MTQAALEQLVREIAADATGDPGVLRFTIDGISMICLSDPRHDRMRIVAAVLDEAQLTEAQRRRVLEANFHSALDARYATSGGVLYAAYIHPLSSLTDDEVRAAVQQVGSLVRTFGNTYSSGHLHFPRPE